MEEKNTQTENHTTYLTDEPLQLLIGSSQKQLR